MNLGSWPDGVPFDPADGVDSLELEAIISGPGAEWPAVVLGADERARRSGWAARAAIDIAEAWARGPRGVVLADLCLERPELHEHLGEANNEGLADVFMFGASPASVTHRREGRSFDFLPPGAYIPDSLDVYRSRDWRKLLRSLRNEGTLLIAYAPLDADGFDALAERLRQVIVLTADLDAAKARVALPSSPVQLVLRPPTAVPAFDLEDEDIDDEPGVARRPPRDEDDDAALRLAERSEDEERVALDEAAAAAAAPDELVQPAAGAVPEDVVLEPAPVETAGTETMGATPADEVEVRDAVEAEAGVEKGAAAGEAEAGVEKGEAAGEARLSDEEFERLRVPRDSEREALIADLRQRQREALLVPPPDAARPAEPAVGRRPDVEAGAGREPAVGRRPDGEAGAGREPAVGRQPPETGAPTGLAAASGPERVAEARPAYPATPPELVAAPTEPDFAALQQRKPQRRRRRWILAATLLTVAILSVVIAGTWHVVGSWLEQRRVAPEPSPAAPPVTTPPVAPPLPEPEVLRFSVAIEAHQNLDVALERVDALSAEESRFNFYITPVLVNGTLFYRLMAGPVADSASAASMMDALLAVGHKTGSSPADVRETPLTFQLGSAASRAEAERRVEELRTLAIPAYIVMQETAAGVVYRVYGGGYTSPADAQVMRELLLTAGQPDSLVERMGSTPR